MAVDGPDSASDSGSSDVSNDDRGGSSVSDGDRSDSDRSDAGDFGNAMSDARSDGARSDDDDDNDRDVSSSSDGSADSSSSSNGGSSSDDDDDRGGGSTDAVEASDASDDHGARDAADEDARSQEMQSQEITEREESDRVASDMAADDEVATARLPAPTDVEDDPTAVGPDMSTGTAAPETISRAEIDARRDMAATLAVAGVDLSGRPVSASPRGITFGVATEAADRAVDGAVLTDPGDVVLANADRAVDAMGDPFSDLAPFEPTSPPDTIGQRVRAGVAERTGEARGTIGTGIGYVGDVVMGAAEVLEVGYEATVVGIEAGTGWIPDDHAASQRADLATRGEALLEAAEEIARDPDGVAVAIAESYEARFEQAGALERAYRSGHGDLSMLHEAARVRAAAKSELAILGVETASMAVGAGAVLKGLRTARIADKLEDAAPIAAALATTQRARTVTQAVGDLVVQPGRRRQIGVEDVRIQVSAAERRATPGQATGRGQPVDGDWMRGAVREERGAPIPGRVADRLEGRDFSSFDRLREAVWEEVAADPVLAAQFSSANRTRMADGRAPFAPRAERVGGRTRFEIDHRAPIFQGGGVYDIDNLQIMTPRTHIQKSVEERRLAADAVE